jgi:hypothetical protein
VTSPDVAERLTSQLSFRAGGGREGCAQGQARSSPQRQVSPDRTGLAVQQGGGCSRDRCRSRTAASGSLGAEGGPPRCGEPAPEGVLRAASCWPRRPQRMSPRGGQRSRLPNGWPLQLRPVSPAHTPRAAWDFGHLDGDGLRYAGPEHRRLRNCSEGGNRTTSWHRKLREIHLEAGRRRSRE